MLTLWILAFVGAAFSWAGDICAVLAARRGSALGIVPAALLFACAAPLWFAMSRLTKGQFVAPAMIWNVAASVLSLAAALALEGPPTPRQWASLALFVAAMLVRG